MARVVGIEAKDRLNTLHARSSIERFNVPAIIRGSHHAVGVRCDVQRIGSSIGLGDLLLGELLGAVRARVTHEGRHQAHDRPSSRYERSGRTGKRGRRQQRGSDSTGYVLCSAMRRFCPPGVIQAGRLGQLTARASSTALLREMRAIRVTVSLPLASNSQPMVLLEREAGLTG